MPPREKKPRGPQTTAPRMPEGQDDTPARILVPCVVLAPPSNPLSDAALRALQEEGLMPRVEHDPRMAMAEACLLRREARQRRGATGQSDRPSPLVLMQTPSDEVDAMLEALHRHVPDLPVLRMEGHRLEELTPASTPVDPPVVAQPPSRPEVTTDELSSLLQGGAGGEAAT